MDKFEYKIKADEIKELIAQGEYEQAAEIADSIDWRRVKSVMMLCTVSDLYKMCRRYEDSRDMLLLAYDRHPGGRTILYSLCELSIKMEEFVQAVEYYKEYAEIAPKDTGRYILQYKLYEAQDVSLEERIAVLEELKKKDYREKWAYELAYLYHRVGLATKCVEECDELVLWFGDGKYVIKALELKKLHAPLTPDQQYKYDQRFNGETADKTAGAVSASGMTSDGSAQQASLSAAGAGVQSGAQGTTPAAGMSAEEMDIQVKTLDVGKYDTINLQEELAAGIQEYFGTANEEAITRSIVEPMMNTDTIDLSADMREINRKVSENEQADRAAKTAQAVWSAQPEQVIRPVQAVQENPEEESRSEVFFGETGEISGMEQEVLPLEGMGAEKTTAEKVLDEMAAERTIQHAQPPREMANVLSMEADGQISFVLPEREPVEKQITGQISINDIILEWERLKKENEEKRKEEVRQRVLQQTGPMFTEFEASVRDGLLEKLENGEVSPEEDLEETLAELFEDKKEEDKAAETDTIAEGVTVAEDAGEATEDLAEDIGEVEELTEIEEVTEAAVEEISPEDAESAEELEEIIETVDSTDEVSETEEIAVTVEAEEAEETEVTVEAEEVEETEVTVEAEEVEEIAVIVEAEEAEETEVTVEAEEAEEIAVIVEAEEVEETEVTVEAQDAEEMEVTMEPEEIADAEQPGAEESALEGTAEIPEAEVAAETEAIVEGEEQPEPVREKRKVRNLTREERELYGQYIQGRSSKEQLIKAIDGISMAAYTGNVIVTGAEGMDSLGLAKNMIREIQMTDSNFSGKTAKISGDSLNTRDVKEIVDGLNNGALIIQKASLMTVETADSLYKALQQEHRGIVVVLEDGKKQMDRFLDKNEKLLSCFTSRVDVAALSDDALVAFGKKYAREKEYSIDEMGLLALHTRIAEMQTSDHAVTIMDVKEIMDEAIESANRKTLGHFFDIIFSRRYDDDDMIILREKDFI